MTKKERADTVNRMLKGEVWVLISTEVMARGMDFKGICGVINYDFPTSVQSYIHRIGRTGTVLASLLLTSNVSDAHRMLVVWLQQTMAYALQLLQPSSTKITLGVRRFVRKGPLTSLCRVAF